MVRSHPQHPLELMGPAPVKGAVTPWALKTSRTWVN